MKKIKRTTIKEILSSPEKYTGTVVDVKGWVRTRRGNKNVQFVALNDGTTIRNLQIVFDLARFPDEMLKPVTTGASIHVQGELVASSGAGQSVEVQAADMEVYGTADPATYPLQKKGHTLEFLREKAHLRPRTNTFGAVLRIRHALAFAVHKFFNDKGFCYFHTPLITASDCEGAGAMFQVTTLPLENLPTTEDGRVTIPRISSAVRPVSPSPASLRANSERRRSVASTRSAPLSVPRIPTLRGISRSSG